MMKRRHRYRTYRNRAAALAASAIFAGLLHVPATQAQEQTPAERQSLLDLAEGLERSVPAGEPGAGEPAAGAVEPDQRDELLGGDWESSGDRAWTTSGDATGFHLLVAEENQGYGWRTVATLAEPGFDADAWIGNACVTGSGEWAVVVYAPRTFTNDPVLMSRGAFSAVVNLDSGDVRRLETKASLSYYNPGCGVDDTAVLTQSGGEDLNATRLVPLHVPAAETARPIEVEGQLTSTVPVGGTLLGASGGRIVEVGDEGELTPVADTDGVPYQLTPDAEGGLVFLDHGDSDTARARHLSARQLDERGATARLLAAGPLTATGLTRTADGQVWLTGDSEQRAGELPETVRLLSGSPRDARASTEGSSLVTEVAWADGRDARDPAVAAGAVRPVRIEMTAMASDEELAFTVAPEAAANPAVSQEPAEEPADEAGARLLSSSTELAESERTCAVPRNSPQDQAMQPKPRQVEWAANQAINNTLNNHISRPANWKNLGMPAYQPQASAMFPRPALSGGGRVPAQILLGVAAQESNLWQASRFTVPGVTGNPLIGNYYGIDLYDGDSSNDWDINWSEADCGYGIMQVTDHMRLAGREDGGLAAWPYEKQRAVALDYTVNLAAGLTILSEKWNQTRDAGMVVNNGDPAKLENWFYALWAYNSGFYPQSQAGANGGAWGVGWFNNPANPEWAPGRDNFLEDRLGNPQYSDAATPQLWPYPEKVLGWAAHPLEGLESPGTVVQGFRPAWWNSTDGDALTPGTAKYYRAQVKPPVDLFCTAANNCDIADLGTEQGPCARADFKCWWHGDAQWKADCSYSCGNELVRFNSTYPEQADGTAYPPDCSLSGFPVNVLVVDSLPDESPSVRPGCDKNWSNAGTFTADFGAGETQDGQRVWPAKVDFHQIGAGFGANFFFAHGRAPDAKGQRLRVEGTWDFNRTVNGPAAVAVHLPDHGARTDYARYEIDTANGTRTRTIAQHGTGNRWVLLGTFLFDGQPEIRLDNMVPGANGEDNVAFDAAMVIPIDGNYVEDTVSAVAYFDENQNLDAFPAAELLPTPFRDRESIYAWAEAASSTVTGLPTCGDFMYENCTGPATEAAMAEWHDDIVAAGTDPVNHPPGRSMASWLNLSNPVAQRPTTTHQPGYFTTDDSSYKIRSSVTVSYVITDDYTLIEGTEEAEFEDRTGDTHLPEFIRDFFAAVQDDYGIAPPDLNYSHANFNEHDGGVRTTDTNTTGILPGVAYEPVSSGPVLRTLDDQAPTDAEPAECVAVQHTAGGSIGYRPMMGSGVPEEVAVWAERINRDIDIAPEVYNIASDIYGYFFSDGLVTLFRYAPPIWQEFAFRVCVSDGLQPLEGNEIFRSSWMPNQYLYREGHAINLDGTLRESAAPVRTGDFYAFSNPITGAMPGGDPRTTPYARCSDTSGKGGNPWGIGPADAPGVDPDGRHCTDISYLN